MVSDEQIIRNIKRFTGLETDFGDISKIFDYLTVKEGTLKKIDKKETIFNYKVLLNKETKDDNFLNCEPLIYCNYDTIDNNFYKILKKPEDVYVFIGENTDSFYFLPKNLMDKINYKIDLLEKRIAILEKQIIKE